MFGRLVPCVIAIGLLMPASSPAADQAAQKRKDKREIKKLIEKSAYFSPYLTGTTKRYGSAYTEGNLPDSSAPMSPLAADAEATLPAGWGRRLETDPVRTSTVIVVGDTATVSTVIDIDATLYVDTSFDGRKNPGAKPIEDTVYRYSTWQKEDGKWHLTEISPAEVRLSDPGRQTVFVTEVKVYVNDTLMMDITDPADKRDVETEIVRVTNGDVVKVEASVTNSSTSGLDPLTYVYCHPNRPVGGRDLMYDDGVNGGDAVAADGVWTYTYTVNLQDGCHHAAIDALDSLCLQNETDDDYNAAAWGMPYVVE
ncbi:MAG: hypothetical protein HYX75_18725 [Acidobacteria bacterium]|nr:hypothetical protein [Acidobacteriota bacterium]